MKNDTELNFWNELSSIESYDNKYLKQYLEHIFNATIQSKDVYGEHHHILPQSIFPQYIKNKSNIKRISAKDHFIAHFLLYKAYPNNQKIIFAFKMMFNMYKKIDNEKLLNHYAIEYEQAKIIVSNLMMNNTYALGYKHTPEEIEQIRQAGIGRKQTLEAIEIIRQSKLGNKYSFGIKRSDEARNNISEAVKASWKRNPNQGTTGKKMPKETKQKMSKSALGNINGTKNYITFNNETLSISVWAKKLGLAYGTINARIRRGWSIEDALTKPIKQQKK